MDKRLGHVASAAALLIGFGRLWNADKVSGPGVGTAAKNGRSGDGALPGPPQGCGPERGALSSFWGLAVSRCWHQAGGHLLWRAPVQGRGDPSDVGGRGSAPCTSSTAFRHRGVEASRPEDSSPFPDTNTVGRSGGQSFRQREVGPFHVDMAGAEHRGLWTLSWAPGCAWQCCF